MTVTRPRIDTAPRSLSTLRFLGHHYQAEAWIALAAERKEDAARYQALSDEAWTEYDLEAP
jgi:hypothetical protein